MKIGYITQKSFTQADEIVKYLCGSMQILGVANMLEFTISPANSEAKKMVSKIMGEY